MRRRVPQRPQHQRAATAWTRRRATATSSPSCRRCPAADGARETRGPDGAGAREERPPRPRWYTGRMTDRASRSRLEITGFADAVYGRASVRRYRPTPCPARTSTRHGRRWPSGRPTPATRRRGGSSPSRTRDLRVAMQQAVDDALDEMAAWPEAAGLEKELKALPRLRDLLRRGAAGDRRLRPAVPLAGRRAATSARGLPRDERDRLRRGPDMQSIGAAVQLLCTAAHAMGYGSCWMTAPVLAAPGHRGAARRGAAAGRSSALGAPSAQAARRRPGPRRERLPVERRPRVPVTRP